VLVGVLEGKINLFLKGGGLQIIFFKKGSFLPQFQINNKMVLKKTETESSLKNNIAK